jgi:hypothetical protein
MMVRIKTKFAGRRRTLASAIVVLCGLLLSGVAAAGSNRTTGDTAMSRRAVEPSLIKGDAQVGALLQASVGSLLPSGTRRGLTFAYQWHLCNSAGNDCTRIAKATDSLYAVRAGDVDHALRLVVTPHGDLPSKPVTSAPTAPVRAAKVDAPVASIRPYISGGDVPGAALTSQVGSWTGKEQIRFVYTWRRCDAVGGSCQPIVDVSRKPVTGPTYRLTANDVGHSLRVLVTAQNAVATSAALSDPTLVTRPTRTVRAAPANTSPPVISGTAALGQRLIVSSGSWDGTPPLRFAFRWLRCNASAANCSTIRNATRQAYVVVRSDVGHTLRVRITARNSVSSRSALSAPTALIVAVGSPVNTSPPTISGTARQGETLTASLGAWKGTQPIRFSGTWQRCNTAGTGCAAIAGATKLRYVLGRDDVGRTLRAQVRATNRVGTAVAVSNPTAVVVARGSAPASSSQPTISGRARQGETLTLSTGTWSGTQPVRFAYAWLRCDSNGGGCSAIAKATSNRYTLTPADVAHRLRGRVRAANNFSSSSALSNPTDLVRGPPVLVSAPTIAGKAEQGQTLVATNGRWTSVSALNVTYQWARCNAQGGDCVPSTGAGPQLRAYTTVAADVGHRLIVQVKASNASGVSFANSKPTDIIAARSVPQSVPVATVSLPDRLVVDRVQFIPRRIRTRSEPLILRVHVSETMQGRSVSGAMVFAVGVPYNRLSAGREVRTGTGGWAQITFRVRATFPLRLNGLVVVFIRARKPGGSALAGVSTRRLVSVRIA